MPETAETSVARKKWNSFVCPGCRLVFRVPQSHDGYGTVCPSCQSLLRLPAEGEETPPLIQPIAEEPEAILEREEGDEAAAPEEEEESSSVALVAGVAVIGLVLLVGFTLWLKNRTVAIHAPPPVALDNPLGRPLPVETDSQGTPVRIGRTQAETERLAEAQIKGFLEAKTIDEAVAFVSQPKRTRERWLSWLEGKPYQTPGFKHVDPATIIEVDGFFSISVMTGDFETHPIALRLEKDELKVDWESWAGWSEMKWSDFRKQKPTKPTLFRVYSRTTDYYNFDFSDEKAWNAYRLDSVDGQNSIYGYAPRTAVFNEDLKPDGRPKMPVMLRLHFPQGAKADNQVIIDEIVGQGWLEN